MTDSSSSSSPPPDPLYREAIDTFLEKSARTIELGVREPAAVSLATVGKDGQPSVRTVLLRGADERGFVFFTNSQSRKGRQLAENPRAALTFYWDAWAEQVHVEGRVEIVSAEESDAYWKTRRRLSQIGAWASDQSRLLDSRETLMERVRAFERRFDGMDVPRPSYWHGYRIIPHRIEFWHGQEGRLHERFVYQDGPDGWTKQMLFP